MNAAGMTIDNPTGDVHIDRMRGVPSDGDIAGMRARNLTRAKAAARAMGPRYCCHPANSPTKSSKNRVSAPPVWLLIS